MTLASDYFIGDRRTWAVALVGIASAPGSVVVLLVSGVPVDWGGRHMDSVQRLLSVPLLVATFLIIEEPVAPAHGIGHGGAPQ